MVVPHPDAPRLELQRALNRLTGGRLANLILTDNRRTILSVQPGRPGDRTQLSLRIHRSFVGAPPDVLQALNRSRPQWVERLAHTVVLASHRANDAQPIPSAGRPRPHWLMGLTGPTLRFAHTWISIFPPRTYLQVRYATPTAPLWVRGAHLREVVPELWAETRDRLRAAAAARAERRAQ